MTNTIIFGGTFDPPHAGHKNLLLSVMSHGYDKAIVIPSKIPPHKIRLGDTDDFNTRFDKTVSMFSDMENVIVSDIENKRDGKSYTFDTLSILKKQYPDDTFHLLIGSDMLLSIENWYRFKDILKETPIISCARTKADYDKILTHKKYLEKNYICDIIIYELDILDLSSTQLRLPLVVKIDTHNKQNLSPKRYDHVMSVANYSAYLASLHGIDPFEAYVAALAHDCTKYMDDMAQLEYFNKNGIVLTEDELKSPKIWHQISGAHFAKYTLGIDNEDMLNAVRYHTTGRVGMSKLEKLVCLADSIEPRRDYEGVDRMRDIAKTSLDKALVLSFDRLIDYIKQRGLTMNEMTLKARDYLLKGITMDETLKILNTAVSTLYKKKGKEIQILKVDDITIMADYFVICTGMSNTQIKALAGEVEFEISKHGIEPLHIEGYDSNEWVLLDYGSVIVHIFYKEARGYYKLERLWADGTELPLSDFVRIEEETTDEI